VEILLDITPKEIKKAADLVYERLQDSRALQELESEVKQCL
jgi:hypothetical protein